MPQLDPTWFASQIFWLVVCFTLLYVLLARVVLPPLSKTIERRIHTVRDDISAADIAKNKAERARQDYEALLAQSRQMSQNLIAEVMAENKAHAEKTLKAMDAEIARKLTDAASRISNKKHELVAGLTPAATEFAAMIAEKITQKPVSTEQTSRVVMDLLKSKGGN
jgi:F-type H+-transporting ATPase subunit b